MATAATRVGSGLATVGRAADAHEPHEGEAMQEYTSPGELPIAPDENLTASLLQLSETEPNRPLVAHRVGDRFVEWTTRQFVDEVLAVAKGLMGLGVEKGQSVCVYSATRLEWTVLDYAIWMAGGVTVPIYETSSSDQIEWIAGNSEAVAIFIENDELKKSYDVVADKLTDLKNAFVIEDAGLEKVKEAGSDVTDEQVRERAAGVGADDIATIVYTSGTTGRPKGCVISHGNFVWVCTQVESAASDFFQPGERTLLFLPLAHIFARMIQVACIRSAVVLGFSTGIPQLVEELGIYKPTFLLAVPRVFEKVFNGAQQKAHADGKGKIFDKAAHVAEDFSRQSAAGKVDLKTKLLHGLFDKLVYGKLRDAMGGQVRYAVSGGAALGERLGHFFNGIGVTILEGYGLTETTAPATMNRPDAFKIGTVGKPLPGCSVKIADDGEVLIKGGNVFQEYYKNPEATKESLTDDGWYHSGDLGSLDGEGYLRITGRKKEIIVTAGGKNVAPAVTEDLIRAHRLISQVMVVGDGQPFIGALVALDSEALPEWQEEHGKTGKTIAELAEDEDVKAEVQKAIDEANKAVSKAESIRAFRILPEDFEVGEELTPTLKVKRPIVAEKYSEVIDEIYSGVKK
jgi:long-chain acyl-CoA synthetase